MTDSKPKILVVDDQRAMRMTLSGVIEDQGYDVTEAEDGYQAIEIVRNNHIDLVLMDIKMPGINGVQAFREIKKISPESVVVMMTGFALEDLVTAALEEGAASVIYKPFDVEQIINIVESVLKSVVILVVDDHASDREILSQILMEKGYNVAGAADGNEAIQMVKDCHYNVILMDIKLPGRDGVTVFEEIHSINPEAKVIFMTGFALDDMVRQALEGGAYPVVYKPIEVQNVLTMVRQLTTGKVV